MPADGAGYSLRYRDTIVPIGPRPLLLGRGPDCNLVLDDPLVSRHHLRASLAEDGVLIEDKSTNGVFMLGRRLAKRTVINGPVTLTIGNVQVEIIVGALPERARTSPTMQSTLAHTQNEIRVTESNPFEDEPVARPGSDATDRAEMLHLMLPVAERMLAQGRAADAEECLSGRLFEALDAGRARGFANPGVAPTAARSALTLAGALGKTEWLDYVLELYALRPDALPIEAVDELYRLAHRGLIPRLALLRQYLDALSRVAGSLGASERFAVQRLRGLERLVASR